MTSFKVQQIAEMLGTHPETVRRWIRANKLNTVRVAQKAGKVVTEEEIQRFLNTVPRYKARFTAVQRGVRPAVSDLPKICPSCGETLVLNRRTGVWMCKGCDYAIPDANIGHVEVLYCCHKCLKFMNKEPEINAKTGQLICTECGYGKDV